MYGLWMAPTTMKWWSSCSGHSMNRGTTILGVLRNSQSGDSGHPNLNNGLLNGSGGGTGWPCITGGLIEEGWQKSMETALYSLILLNGTCGKQIESDNKEACNRRGTIFNNALTEISIETPFSLYLALVIAPHLFSCITREHVLFISVFITLSAPFW